MGEDTGDFILGPFWLSHLCHPCRTVPATGLLLRPLPGICSITPGSPARPGLIPQVPHHMLSTEVRPSGLSREEPGMREQRERRWQPTETRNHQVRGKVHHPHRETHKTQRERKTQSPPAGHFCWGRLLFTQSGVDGEGEIFQWRQVSPDK